MTATEPEAIPAPTTADLIAWLQAAKDADAQKRLADGMGPS